MIDINEECPTCKGTGHIGRKACSTCKGMGVIKGSTNKPDTDIPGHPNGHPEE